MTKLVVFDLDGTLATTLGDLAASVNAVLAAHGYAGYPQDRYRQFLGDGTRKLLERACAPYHLSAGQIDEIQRDYMRYYNDHCLANSPLYPGVALMLERLRQAGIYLAVVTNKPHDIACRLVQARCGDLVDCVIGQREGQPRKPDPAVVLQLMQKRQVSCAQTVFVGDSNVDIFTAQRAGVFAAGVSWGFRGRQELLQAKADAVFDTAQQLTDFLLQYGEKNT